MMVRFATTCDVNGCGCRSEEFSSWPRCRECSRHVCPKHQVPGSDTQDERNEALCASCYRGVVQ